MRASKVKAVIANGRKGCALVEFRRLADGIAKENRTRLSAHAGRPANAADFTVI